MSSPIGGAGKFGEKILATLQNIQREARDVSTSVGGQPPNGAGPSSAGPSFADHLAQGIKDVNQAHKVADKMGMELATGKTGNIHETMLAATQAELSFNLMVQLRNKALEAYSEVIRMPV